MIFAGLLASLGSAFGQEGRRDILLVERPDRLVILNAYQQRLNLDEYRALGQFAPMVVVREFDKLSDGITPCASVELDGQAFYIERDSAGDFVRRGTGAAVRLIRNAVLLDDSVTVFRGEALRFHTPEKNQSLRLPAGARAVRLFRDEKETFVRLVSTGHLLGWIALDESGKGTQWTVSGNRSGGVLSVETVLLRLTPVIDAANRTLGRIFERFSEISGIAHTPPSFHLTGKTDTVLCTIEPPSAATGFSSSLRALIPECERVLSGTGIHPIVSGGAIVISVR